MMLTVLAAVAQPTAKQWNSEVTAGWNSVLHSICEARPHVDEDS